jgi:hypothetical protein
MRRFVLTLVVLFSLMLSSAQLVFAGGNGAITSTQNDHGLTQTFHVDPICGSPSGTLTATVNDVFHTTTNTAGDFWLTSTQEGWFTIVPDDPSLPNFAGHFATWFGVSINMNNAVQHDITNIFATATDGSGTTITIHSVDHLSMSATGHITSFMNCH